MITRSIPVAAAVLVLLLASARATSVLCDPDCSDHMAGDKVGDPRNCTQFYVCINTNVVSAYPVACNPPLGIFDPSVGECVAGMECGPSCNAPVCKIKCKGVLDVISDPWDCNTYYYCDAAYNAGPAQHCPVDRPYFDGVTCTFDETMCCESPCTPICGSGDVQVPDPLDCTKYYLCLEEGTPTEDTHHTCDPGATFQPTSSLCVAGGTCYTLCGGTTATTTTTTTTTTTVTTTEPTTTETIPTTPSTTTSTIPSTTTTILTTTATDCIQFLRCPDAGYFPMCFSCQPMYFECHEEGASGVPMMCPEGYVFNTVPGYYYCVRAEDCPYNPSTHTTQ